jgi:hypothetical protein
MSLRYEVVFSCFLVDDTPAEVLDELRWHLGLPDGPLTTRDGEDACPLLRPDPDSYLPGGEVAFLRRQMRGTRRGHDIHAWGLFTRNGWHDDAIGEMAIILDLIAPNVVEDGYGGYFREEYDAEPRAFVFRDRGYSVTRPPGDFSSHVSP